MPTREEGYYVRVKQRSAGYIVSTQRYMLLKPSSSRGRPVFDQCEALSSTLRLHPMSGGLSSSTSVVTIRAQGSAGRWVVDRHCDGDVNDASRTRVDSQAFPSGGNHHAARCLCEIALTVITVTGHLRLYTLKYAPVREAIQGCWTKGV